MNTVRKILILVPILFTSRCALFDRSDGYPQLNHVGWKSKNIIVVLGMRSERSGDKVTLPKFAEPRVRESERLYRACKLSGRTCLILASGGDPAGNGVTEAELIKRELVKNQIPQSDILLENKSGSTDENAKNSSALLLKQSPDLIVLVTSDVHLPRAMKEFESSGIFPLPAPAFPPFP